MWWALEQVGAQLGEGVVGAVAGAGAGHVDHAGEGTCTGSLLAKGAQQQHPVGEVQRLLDVMGDDQDGGGLGGVDLQQQVLHAQPGEGVERAEGLVQQQHLGAAGEGPGERGALGHAARDLAGAQVRGVLEADELQQVPHPVAARGAVGAAGQAEGDVLLECAPGQQARLLEGDGGAVVGARQGRAADPDHSRAGAVQACDQAQQGGLAAAGGAHHGDDLARAELDVEAAQHVVPALGHVEGAGDLVQAHPMRTPARRGRVGVGPGIR